MTSSAPRTPDWNSRTTALLVIGSILWLGLPPLCLSIRPFKSFLHPVHDIRPGIGPRVLRAVLTSFA
jgi:hypothetical protein